MKDKIENLAIGTIKEGADHVLGTVKAIKYLAYGITMLVGLAILGGAIYIAYNTLN